MKNESPLDPLLKLIGSVIPVTPDMEACLSGLTSIRYYPRDFVLARAGETIPGLSVMLKGLAHASGTENGAPTSYWFAAEGQLLAPAVKNGRDIIAPNQVTVLEDSFIAFIPYPVLNSLAGTAAAQDFSKVIQYLQQQYNANLALREAVRKQEAAQRLRSLQHYYPRLEHRAGATLVAAYLGLTPGELKQLTML